MIEKQGVVNSITEITSSPVRKMGLIDLVLLCIFYLMVNDSYLRKMIIEKQGAVN